MGSGTTRAVVEHEDKAALLIGSGYTILHSQDSFSSSAGTVELGLGVMSASGTNYTSYLGFQYSWITEWLKK
jgi:hypothetical protein